MNQSLRNFRNLLEAAKPPPNARLFTCTGSPYKCDIFIVGLNSATQLGHNFFERFWDDSTGFLRDQFEADYNATRKKKGVRPRMEAIVNGASPIKCLETNIYCVPTKKASELRKEHKNPTIFEILLREIKPKIIFAHSNEPIRYFLKASGHTSFPDREPTPVTLQGFETTLIVWSGPLFTKKIHDSRNLGEKLRAYTIPA